MKPLYALPLMLLGSFLSAAPARAQDAAHKPLRGLGAVRENGAARPERLPASDLRARTEGEDFVLEFSFKDGALERSGSFRAASGAQTNYVAGGEDPFEVSNKQGTAIEWKKNALIINVNLRSTAKNELAGEIQAEISGVQPPDPKSVLKGRPVTTFQLQTSFHAELGKPFVLVDDPGRRLEITLSRAK